MNWLDEPMRPNADQAHPISIDAVSATRNIYAITAVTRFYHRATRQKRWRTGRLWWLRS